MDDVVDGVRRPALGERTAHDLAPLSRDGAAVGARRTGTVEQPGQPDHAQCHRGNRKGADRSAAAPRPPVAGRGDGACVEVR